MQSTQREGEVVHVIAKKLVDLSPLLGSLGRGEGYFRCRAVEVMAQSWGADLIIGGCLRAGTSCSQTCI
ncbi:hypothetical protein A8G00_08800 [Sphingobium sp. SA916]|nr:hypothetical protein A8G00_08800 [Sphingobium sp. SA916]